MKVSTRICLFIIKLLYRSLISTQYINKKSNNRHEDIYNIIKLRASNVRYTMFKRAGVIFNSSKFDFVEKFQLNKKIIKFFTKYTCINKFIGKNTMI